MRALLRRLYASLSIPLCTYQEMRVPSMSSYHLPDDATEDELTEMAAERRQLAMEQRERATTGTRWPVEYAIFRRTHRELPGLAALDLYDEHDAQALRDFDAWSGYGSDIAELNN